MEQTLYWTAFIFIHWRDIKCHFLAFRRKNLHCIGVVAMAGGLPFIQQP
jgi:hypothetical protein